jgi:aryl-alcohol dehydrogenase-like predicted oxidoreductase
MELTPLGRTGPAITRLGLGSWALGGGGAAFGWGDQDDAESIATIRHALDRGLNWVDTAAFYGAGHAEEVVGQAIASVPYADRPYVFTKGGLPYVDGRSRRVTSPESLRREVEGSLRRLRVERIDLYQVHWPGQDGTPLEDTWAAMLGFVDEGKIAAAGVSNYTVAELEASAAAGPIGSVQTPLSLVNRRAVADIVPWAGERGIGVVTYSPMAHGLLSGSFTAERAAALPPNDWRRTHGDFRRPRLERSLALAEALRLIGGRHDTTPGCVAIAWALGCPGVSSTIVGARRPPQVDGWIGATDVKLTDEDLADIAAAVERTGAGAGPVRW